MNYSALRSLCQLTPDDLRKIRVNPLISRTQAGWEPYDLPSASRAVAVAANLLDLSIRTAFELSMTGRAPPDVPLQELAYQIWEAHLDPASSANRYYLGQVTLTRFGLEDTEGRSYAQRAISILLA